MNYHTPLRILENALALCLCLLMSTMGTARAADAQQDQFHRSFRGLFSVSGCTANGKLLTADITVFQSVTDWRRLAQGRAQAFQRNFDTKTQAILNRMWKTTVSAYTSDIIKARTQSFIDDVSEHIHRAGPEIENATGVSVILRATSTGPPGQDCH